MIQATSDRSYFRIAALVSGWMAIGAAGAEETISNASPVQIEVEVRYVQHAKGKDGLEWFLNADPKANPVVDNAALLRFLKSKDTETLSAPRLVTWSGREGTVKAVREFRYPTEYTVQVISSNGPNDAVAVGVPGTFETREVGTILKALPVWDPAKKQIDLQLDVSLTSEPMWKDYGSQYTTTNGTAVTLRMEQPFFRVRSISTAMTLHSSASVVMGGMIEEDGKSGGRKSLFIIVTARLIDKEGKTLKGTPDLETR